MKGRVARHAVAWLVAGVGGAVVFWLVQVAAGGPTITAFMGERIVSAGGYPGALAPLVGWAVHVAVGLSYALVSVLVSAALARTSFPVAATVALLAAVALGWGTAVIAPPAISVAIGILSGRGWPEELFPPNFGVGLPLWNHLVFFLLSWAVQLLILRPPVGSRPGPGGIARDTRGDGPA